MAKNLLDEYTKTTMALEAFIQEHPELAELQAKKASLETEIKEQVRSTGEELSNKAFKVTIDRPYSKWIDWPEFRKAASELAKKAEEKGIVKVETSFDVDMKALTDFCREENAMPAMQEAYREEALTPRVSIKVNKEG